MSAGLKILIEALEECGKPFLKSDLQTKKDLVGAASYRMSVARITLAEYRDTQAREET